MTLEPITISLRQKGTVKTLQALSGETLRECLLRHEQSPYRGKFVFANCRGLGICGSCKVKVKENGEWWERRSCQVKVYRSLEVEPLNS